MGGGDSDIPDVVYSSSDDMENNYRFENQRNERIECMFTFFGNCVFTGLVLFF